MNRCRTTRRAIVLATLILGACGGDLGTDLSEARRQMAEGHLEVAMESYQKVLEARPEHIEALVGLAEAHLERGENELAEPYIKKALLLHPEKPGPNYVNGRLLLARELWLQAEQSLEKASRLELFDTDILFYLALAVEELNEPDKAIEIYKRLLSLQPDYPTVHRRLGNLLFSKNAYDGAMQEYEQAIDEEPGNPLLLEKLALSYHYQQFNDSARRTAERALEVAPESATAYNILGAVDYSNRDVNSARTHFKKALELDPDHVAAHLNLGAIYNVDGEPEKARIEFKKVLELEPRNIQARRNLGDLYMSTGNVSEALEQYRIYHEARPKDPLVAFTLAKLISVAPDGDPAEGHAFLLKFERVSGLDVALNEIRYLETARGEKPTGEKLDTIRGKYPYLPDVMAVRAILFERQKDLTRAEEIVRAALLMRLDSRKKAGFEARLEYYERGEIPPPPPTTPVTQKGSIAPSS